MKSITPLVGGVAAVGLIFGVVACSSEPEKPSSSGQNIADKRQNVTLKNDVEGKNYNRRLQLADDPASLIWCTGYPPAANQKAFTVPIVGKLTSGNKRPTPTEKVRIDTDTLGSEYNPELPGPDGMFGSSGEYRYGFDPAGNYHEFYGMAVRCTSVPTIIQKESLEITLSGDASDIDRRVQEELKECQKTNKDMTVACPKAAQLLGVNN